jgi:hypothetical protein
VAAARLIDRLSRLHLDAIAWFDHRQTMKDGPDVSITATLIGDPARANMVMALMSGYSLTMGKTCRRGGATFRRQRASRKARILRRSQLVSNTTWVCRDRQTQCRHHRELRIISS